MPNAELLLHPAGGNSMTRHTPKLWLGLVAIPCHPAEANSSIHRGADSVFCFSFVATPAARRGGITGGEALRRSCQKVHRKTNKPAGRK